MWWLWLIWFASLSIILVVSLGYAATVPLLRRREPDEPDSPTAHGMPCEDVSFASVDGLTLGGWWIPAPAPTRGTIVLCPGQNGSMDKDTPQAKPLHDTGFNVFMFDFRAHGRSDGQMVTMGVLEQLDLRGALDYLEQERDIRRVGVMGFSMGSAVALLTAAEDARIAALVVDGAYPRLSSILTAWGRLRGLPRFMATGLAWMVMLVGSLRSGYQLFRANPVDLASRVSVPTLLIHGARDSFVSDAEIEALRSAISGPAEVWTAAEAGHRQAFHLHTADYNRRVVAWFGEHLSSEDDTPTGPDLL